MRAWLRRALIIVNHRAGEYLPVGFRVAAIWGKVPTYYGGCHSFPNEIKGAVHELTRWTGRAQQNAGQHAARRTGLASQGPPPPPAAGPTQSLFSRADHMHPAGRMNRRQLAGDGGL